MGRAVHASRSAALLLESGCSESGPEPDPKPASHDGAVCLLVDELAEQRALGVARLPRAHVSESALREMMAGFDDTRHRFIEKPRERHHPGHRYLDLEHVVTIELAVGESSVLMGADLHHTDRPAGLEPDDEGEDPDEPVITDRQLALMEDERVDRCARQRLEPARA